MLSDLTKNAPGSASDAQGSATITLPPAASPAEMPTLAPSPSVTEGQHRDDIPGYEILGELGRGGMGVVYQARDIKLNRLVALKLVLGGSHANPDLLTRFLSENRATASLRHPGIVQLYEVGEQNGLPYAVLEYVNGGSLAAKLRGTPLAATDAVRIVEALARAMHCAHQQGIIHRDLKPANILLDATDAAGPIGQPKITDFGLALLMESASNLTRTGTAMGTPSYMAPEQAEGRKQDISPRTDVYALGAILYELLTGRPPFRAETPLDTMMQVIASEVVPPRQLQPKTPRDVETICLKALQKDSRKRYVSAAALADDLASFLGGRPIHARPVTNVERFWRWCRRNPRVAILSGLLVVALLGGLAGIAWQWQVASAERDIAQKERNEAADERNHAQAILQRSAQFVNELVSRAVDEGMTFDLQLNEERRQLLDAALQFYGSFDAEASNPVLQREMARAKYMLASVRIGLRQYPEAKTAYDDAIRMQQRLVANEPAAPQYQLDLAESHRGLALVHQFSDHIPEARASYAEAIRLGTRLHEFMPSNAAYAESLAHTNRYYGLFCLQTQDLATGRRVLQSSAAIMADLAAQHPTNVKFQASAADNHTRLGYFLVASQSFQFAAEAEQSLVQARALWDKLLREDAKRTADYRAGRADTLVTLAQLYAFTRRRDQAEEPLKEGVAILEKLAADKTAWPMHRYQLAMGWLTEGVMRAQQMKPAEAEHAWKRSAGVLEALVQEYPRISFFFGQYVQVHFMLADLYRRQGRVDDALALLQTVLERSEGWSQTNATIAHFRGQLRTFHMRRNDFLSQVGRHDEAVKGWDRVLELASAGERAHALIHRACALARSGRHAEAVAEAKNLMPEAKGGTQLYNLACVLALAGAAAAKDAALPDAERERIRTAHLAAAMEFLRKSKAAGGLQSPAQKRLLNNDKDLDALRDRDDFKKFVAELEKDVVK